MDLVLKAGSQWFRQFTENRAGGRGKQRDQPLTSSCGAATSSCEDLDHD
jgi:hypothetical protein